MEKDQEGTHRKDGWTILKDCLQLGLTLPEADNLARNINIWRTAIQELQEVQTCLRRQGIKFNKLKVSRNQPQNKTDKRWVQAFS